MKLFWGKSILCGLIGLGLVLSACSSSPAGSTGASTSGQNEVRASQSFAVTGDVTVTINTYNGDVTVNSGNAAEVKVDVIKHGGGATDAGATADPGNIPRALTQTSGNVELAATPNRKTPSNSSASFLGTMPAGSTWAVALDNGTIRVDGIGGGVTATSTNGDITFVNANKGGISAKTTNGNVTTGGTAVASLTATSSNGNVSFAGSLADSSAANRLETGNGNADLTLPATAQFNLDAQTENGALTSDFVFQGDTSSKTVNGTVGASPGFKLTVRVKNGLITVKKS